jgi:hypothetical protein
MSLNTKAQEFYPKWAKDEDKLYDELERNFVLRNPWIFEDENTHVFNEYASESSINKIRKERSKRMMEVLERRTKRAKVRPLYSSIVKK